MIAKTTHELIDGRWQTTGVTVPPERAERNCFLIVCDYGDWSGFRTLKECLAQVPTWQGRPPGFFRIEMR